MKFDSFSVSSFAAENADTKRYHRVQVRSEEHLL